MFPKSFDSYIDKEITITGNMFLNAGSRTVVDGTIYDFTTIERSNSNVEKVESKKCKKTEIVLNGRITGKEKSKIEVPNVTINGTVNVDEIRVECILKLNSKAVLKAKTIYYRSLIITPGAVILGNLVNLDYASTEEVTENNI